MWINFLDTNNLPGILGESHGIIWVRTRDYDLYILEQLSSCSTSRIHPSWPWSRLRLSLLLAFHSKCIHCCHVSSSILLFIPTERVSHLNPLLLSGWLLTNVQVNNTTTLHDTHRHTYIHHIGITILLPFYTSSTLLGRLAGPDSSCRIQFWSTNFGFRLFSCTYVSDVANEPY